MKYLKNKITRKNVKWVIRTNVQSWLLQAAVMGALTLVGCGAVMTIVGAKAVAYTVFAGQCVSAYRGRS